MICVARISNVRSESPPLKKGGGEIVIKSNNYALDIHWSIGIDANGIKGEITPQQQLSDRA